MSDAAVHGHAHAAVQWPPDAQYGSATPGKIGMWIFLVSDAFGFGGFLIGYGILRNGAASAWIPAGEPPLGVVFTAALTFLLLCTSVTNVLAYVNAVQGERRGATMLLAITALGGILFELGQAREWAGLMREGLLFGHSARASTFYVITGYHGLHVMIGIVYILAVLFGYLRGRAGPRQIELLSLYWCFVDFVWVFVFSFVYLMP